MTLRKKALDGETIFKDYWQMMGDARSLNILSKKFPKNPLTGERITKDAGYKAMWRWACRPENETKGFHIFKRSTFGSDPEWTAARWHDELKEKARWALTPDQYQRWYLM